MNEVHQLENMDSREEFSENLKFAQLTKAAVKESQRWIEFITGDKFKHRDNFIKSLQDGVLLCRLANNLKAGCIRRINQMQTPVAYLDNLSLFQISCREEFGLQEAQLFDIRDLDDLDVRGTLGSEEEFRRETDRRLRNVLVTLYWLGRVARPLRPDAELDLHAFEALVDPSYFDFALFGEPEQTSTVVGERIEVVGKNGASGNTLREKTCWESKFADLNNGSKEQVHSASRRELETGVGNGCHQRLVQHGSLQAHNIIVSPHQQISKFIEQDDDDDDVNEEAPAPPNWDTFPGASPTFDSYDVECLVEAEEGHSFALHPDTSSSSSASSFATKDFLVKDHRSPRVVQCLSSPTAALLSASPETLSHDEISDNFERLLRDVERFSVIRKSQSLKHLEDFDEVGFEEQEADSNGGSNANVETNGDSRQTEVERPKTDARENGIEDDEETNQSKTSERKLERRKSDFMDELLTLNEATKKYDATSSISPCHHDPSFPSGFSTSDRTVTLQSPELLEKPKQRSAEATEILRQNSFGSSTSPPSGRNLRSTYMERFAHDLGNVLKFERSNGGDKSSSGRRMFDLEQERRRMEEWNRKAEEKLKDKFEKDQDLLKEKLKEDLRRAHQVERMKQLQEEKFLEEEVIEVKNRRSFASENSKRSKFSKSSLSLFAPLPSKTRGIRSASPGLPPTFTSLTDDWLSQSFSSDVEKPSFDDTLPGADLVPPFGEAGRPEPRCREIDDNDDAFEEPAWMKLKTEKVDKMSIVDVPVNRATIEVLPDSPTTSSESIHSASLDRSEDEFRGTAVAGLGFEADVTRSTTLDTQPDESSSPLKDTEAPPIPDRDDSLLVTSDILTSREQAAYLTFDTSISNFNKSSSTHFLDLTQSNQQIVASSVTSPAGGLLTPSSDRCSEVYRCEPPSTITLHKRTASPKDSISSVFPSPRSPSNDRPDFLCLTCEGSEGPQSSSRSVDHLFAYHDDQLRRRYYWATSPVPSNCVSPVELPSDPKMGSRVNRPQEKASCTGCGYCLATEQTINIYALKGLYHPECFKCKGCDAPLNAENVAIYQSVPHCFTCFGDLSRH